MEQKYYLVLDTETATLPSVKSLDLTPAERKKVAIAKPLIYDIAWAIVDSVGNVAKSVHYLVQETFFVPQVFNTAYYKDKRPLYMQMLAKGEVTAKLWQVITAELEADLKLCELATAYNACFDYKKAMRFTNAYIEALYSDDYDDWERKQFWSIIHGNKWQNPTYNKPTFEINGNEYPFADLWGLACEKLINIDLYRNYCLEHNRLTNSKLYFATSAEVCYQYLENKPDFVESHTALADVEIETKILIKILEHGEITPQIEHFPFKLLGTTYEYAKQKQPQYVKSLTEQIEAYANTVTHQSFLSQIEQIIGYLNVAE